MKTQLINELRAFHAFLGEELAKGDADMSPEDAVDIWRETHSDEGFTDDVAAIQEALDSVDRGEHGIRLEDFDHELRKEFNLPELRGVSTP